MLCKIVANFDFSYGTKNFDFFLEERFQKNMKLCNINVGARIARQSAGHLHARRD